MIKFKTRQEAREFKSRNAKFHLVDLGPNTKGKRWAVKVL